MIMRISLLILMLALLLAVVGCGDSSQQPSSTPQEDVVLEDSNSSIAGAADAKVAELTSKYLEALTLVDETYYTAFENGWQYDDALNAELEMAVAFLEVIDEDLKFPERMDIEYMDTLIKMIDEMIPTWEGFMLKASEPYQEK